MCGCATETREPGAYELGRKHSQQPFDTVPEELVFRAVQRVGPKRPAEVDRANKLGIIEGDGAKEKKAFTLRKYETKTQWEAF